MKIFIHIRLILVLLFTLNLQSTILNQQTSSLYAQDPQLFENDWYLQKVVIDGIDIFPPYPSVIGRVYFDTEFIEVVHPDCEEGFGKSINYLPDNIFETDNGGVVLLGICGDPLIIEFMDKHYSIYYDLNNEIAKNPFTYNFTQDNSLTNLTIVNTDGDKAIYGNEPLSINDIMAFDLTIYPNPSENAIFINSKGLYGISEFILYNSIGSVVFRTKHNDNPVSKLDISHVSSGLYILGISLKNGNIIYKKIVKK